MSLLTEFKAFAVRGNVVDMAVGIIMGAAFGKVVSSLVNDVVMPPLGMLIGGVHFGELAITLKQATGDTPAVVLGYGAFIQNLVDFLVVALAVFVAVKVMNELQRHEDEVKEQAPLPPPPQEVLLREIRDLLRGDTPR